MFCTDLWLLILNHLRYNAFQLSQSEQNKMNIWSDWNLTCAQFEGFAEEKLKLKFRWLKHWVLLLKWKKTLWEKKKMLWKAFFIGVVKKGDIFEKGQIPTFVRNILSF